MSHVEKLLTRCAFPAAGTAVDVGVSGGADSTALLVLAVHAGCTPTAVHVDHALREGSAAEAELVAATAARLGVAFRSEQVTVEPGANLEARARHSRYEVLGPDALVGHTLDDRAETILLNLMRGAGARGLASLHAPDPRRPLLALRRADTVALCAELGFETVDDPSNDDPRFVRNRIRHELIPLMNAIAGRDVAPLLVRTSDLIAADDEVLGAIAERIDPTDVGGLNEVSEPIAARALRTWLEGVHDGYAPEMAEVGRVLDVVRGVTRATELVGGARVRRRAGRLEIDPLRVSTAEEPGE